MSYSPTSPSDGFIDSEAVEVTGENDLEIELMEAKERELEEKGRQHIEEYEAFYAKKKEENERLDRDLAEEVQEKDEDQFLKSLKNFNNRQLVRAKLAKYNYGEKDMNGKSVIDLSDLTDDDED